MPTSNPENVDPIFTPYALMFNITLVRAFDFELSPYNSDTGDSLADLSASIDRENISILDFNNSSLTVIFLLSRALQILNHW